MKKFKLTKNSKVVNGITLHQIQALKDFSNVKKGDLGGWIEKEENLSQDNNAQVSGDAWVFEDAQVYGEAHIKYSTLIIPIVTFKEPEYILASLNAVAVNGKYTLYKRVNKVNDGKYVSVYDKNFKYTTGKISTEKECDINVLNSCSSGIHLSHPTYWNEGDTLIACEVKVEDIITCQQGKVRVKKCKVLGEVNIWKRYEPSN